MARYIERPGEISMRPPLAHLRCTFRCFWLRADRERLRSLCDTTFDGPSHGAVPVEPLGDAVALVWAEIPEIRSTHPLDAGRGYASEIDVSLWIPVRVGDGRSRVAWYIPWLFVDSDLALILGREMYGFPKTLGTFTSPPLGETGSYRVDARVVERAGAAVRATSAKVLEIRPTGGPRPSRARALANLASFSGLLDPAQWLAGARSWQQGDRPGADMVFLRQLRDVADADEAALQEIVEAPAEVLAVHGGGLMTDAYEVLLPRNASLPIADALGLKADGHPVEAAFHVTFDFVVAGGRTLWRAPPPATAERPTAAALARVSTFQGFDADELEALANQMRVVRPVAGQALVTEGDPNRHDGMYVVLDGHARLTRDEPGATYELTLGPGDVFGLLALVVRGPRSATVRAEGGCVIASLDRNAFEGLRRSRSPTIASKLERMVARQLARDFQALSARLRESLGPAIR